MNATNYVKLLFLFALAALAAPQLSGQISSFRTEAGSQLICVWNQVTLRSGPGKSAPYVTGVFFGETVKKTGEEAYAREEQRTYLKVETSEGTVGWVHEFLFVEGIGLATVMKPGRIYKRPRTVSTITDQSFLPGELVVLVNQNNGWLHLMGREKKKAGWIEGTDNVTTQYRELELASLLYEANQKKPQQRQDALQSLLAEARRTGSPLAQTINMQLRGQTYEPPLIEGNEGRSRTSSASRQGVGSGLAQNNASFSSAVDRNRYLNGMQSGPTNSRTSGAPAADFGQRDQGRMVEESGQVTIISSRSHEPDIFYAYHKTVPTGTSIYADIPGNPGFVELRVVGKLPPSSAYLIGLPVACYDALLGPARSREIHITYER